MRKDGVDLRVDLPHDLPRVGCRPQQIRQIAMSLITNARDVLNERFEGFDERKQIAIRGARVEREGRSWLSLELEDQGGGIPEGVRERIFDPFFTTKGRDRGTGLGLAVSHGIAVEHGGQLNVDTELGVGTTFELLLPLDPEHQDGDEA